MNMLDKMRELIDGQLACGRPAIEPNATFGELGADYLDVIGIIVEVEERFDVQITDDEAETIETVGDLIELIERKQPSTAVAA